VNPLHHAFPSLTRHAGVWEGEYSHVGTDFTLQDRHLFRIKVEFPERGDAHYRQTSHYWWPDGRTEQRVFEAAWNAAENALTWDNGRIHGRMWQIDATTNYLSFGFHAEPGSRVCEMIQLGDDGRRVRTWHWFREHSPWRITLVREHRVSTDPAAFDAMRDAPAWPPPGQGPTGV
jgi:hypothetical protein